MNIHIRIGDFQKKETIPITTAKKVGLSNCIWPTTIEHASAKEFRGFFDNHISKIAKILTGEWKGYSPLKMKYPSL